MKEKVVFITGAKGGLGSFITRRFLVTGATVVGASRSISQQDFPGCNFTALAVDFTKAAAVNDAVQSVITRFGRLDVLVHVLGGFAGGQTVAETDDATWERMCDLNLTSSFYLLRAAVPHLRLGAHACEHRGVHRAVLQSAAVALSVGLSFSGRIRTAEGNTQSRRERYECKSGVLSGVDGGWVRWAKTGDVAGRASCRSSFLGPPGVEFWSEQGRVRQIFLGRGRRRPLPKIPRLPGRREGNSSYCRCAQRICLTEGVQSTWVCPILCPPSREMGFRTASSPGVNVPGTDCDRRVTGNPCQGPSVTTGLAQTSKKGVAEVVQQERANRFPVILRGLCGNVLERRDVCLPEGWRFSVAALCWRSPDPAFRWFLREQPKTFQSCPHSRSHGNYPPCSRRLAVRDEECSVAPIRPCNRLPPQPETLFRAHPGIRQHRCHARCVGCCS